MIAILDYDMGNVASIKNMLEHIGFEAMITHDFEQLSKASQLILPGVGSFDHGVNSLKERGLFDYLKQSNKPILGICLGMQLLGNQSEEGNEKGLELIDFDNVKFKFEDQKLKVPHMGWNDVKVKKIKNPILKDISSKDRFYFVHSYHAKPKDDNLEILSTSYGYDFTSAVNYKNVYGVQFHPEKSHQFGMKILKNFGEIHA